MRSWVSISTMSKFWPAGGQSTSNLAKPAPMQIYSLLVSLSMLNSMSLPTNVMYTLSACVSITI